MRRSALLVLPLIIVAGLVAAQPAFAQLPTLVPAACRGTASLSECGLNQVVQVFINVAQFIFGISGSAALLMFIYGGFLWLTSAGRAEQVKAGQAVISGAVIGLFIIFGAYVGVQFLIGAIRGPVAAGDIIIPGEHCGSGTAAGLAVYTGNPAATSTAGLECIPFNQCGNIGTGWSEITLTDATRASYTCVDGLVTRSGAGENVKCCRLNAGASPSGGGGGTGGGAGGPAPAGTSGRNNCTCADRGVNGVSDCAACVSYCTSRTSNMIFFNDEPRGSCGPIGTCTCSAGILGGLATDAQIEQARAACVSYGGTFTDRVCTGRATEDDCSTLDASLTAPVGCDWTE